MSRPLEYLTLESTTASKRRKRLMNPIIRCMIENDIQIRELCDIIGIKPRIFYQYTYDSEKYGIEPSIGNYLLIVDYLLKTYKNKGPELGKVFPEFRPTYISRNKTLLDRIEQLEKENTALTMGNISDRVKTAYVKKLEEENKALTLALKERTEQSVPARDHLAPNKD